MNLWKEIKNSKKIIAAAFVFLLGTLTTVAVQKWYERWENEGNLILTEQEPHISGRNYTSNFTLENNSDRPCTDVTVVIRTLLTDRLIILPYHFDDIKQRPHLCEKDWLLSFDRLRPHEHISIIIKSNVDSMYFANVIEPRMFINDLGELNRNITLEQIQAAQNSTLEYPKVVSASFSEKLIKRSILPRAQVVGYLQQRCDSTSITGTCGNQVIAKD